MTVTAPVDVNTPHEDTLTRDDIAVDETAVDETALNNAAVDGTAVLHNQVAAQVGAVEHRDPAMVLVYFGILSLIAIIAVSAFLAL